MGKTFRRNSLHNKFNRRNRFEFDKLKKRNKKGKKHLLDQEENAGANLNLSDHDDN